MIYYSRSIFEIYIWRAIIGIGIGIASILGSVYLAEISPSSIRGKIVSIQSIFIVVGYISSTLVGLLFAPD